MNPTVFDGVALDVIPGAPIFDVIEHAIQYAKDLNVNVYFIHNDYGYKVKPTSTFQDVIDKYNRNFGVNRR